MLTAKIGVSHALDERLHPRTLRFILDKLPEEFRMRLSVDPIFGRPIRLPLVGIIESTTR